MSGSLEGDLSSRPSNVPLSHSWDLELEGGPWFRHEKWPSLLPLKQGPGGFLLCWLMERWSHVGQWLKGDV